MKRISHQFGLRAVYCLFTLLSTFVGIASAQNGASGDTLLKTAVSGLRTNPPVLTVLSATTFKSQRIASDELQMVSIGEFKSTNSATNAAQLSPRDSVTTIWKEGGPDEWRFDSVGELGVVAKLATIGRLVQVGTSDGPFSSSSNADITGRVESNIAKGYYIAQTSTGRGSGTDCASALPMSFFNTADSWGVGTGQIGPGTTIHLCGTFTGSAGSTMLTTRGAGASGSPITILFESGASFTAPYWSAAGAFQINHSFIVVDGGSNGLITATANGTSLTNQVVSDAIHIGESGAPNDVEIKNLTISNMCVRAANSSNTSCEGNGIRLLNGGGNVLIHHNVIHDIGNGILFAINASETGDQIYSNNIYNRDAGIIYCACGGGTIANTAIYDNTIGSAANWDDPADHFHHDGIHFFNGGGTTAVIGGALIYNNTFNGGLGVHSTADIFLEDSWNGAKIFNNLLVNTSGFVNDGLITLKGGTAAGVYNNTIFCPAGGAGIGLSNSRDNSIRNNIISGCTTGLNVQNSNAQIGLSSDYADYHNVSQWYSPAGMYYSISEWRASGLDAHSMASNPNLSSFIPLVGSPVIGTGLNLSSLGIPALNIDKSGAARPRTAPWNIGAQ